VNFPNWWDAPEKLLRTDGHCGLIAAWAVLRYFGKPTSVHRLIADCRYTKRHGVFTVALAAALKKNGLSVSFHSVPDENVGGFERRCYAYARHLGISAEPPIGLSTLLRECRKGRVPILFFNTPEDNGHFSPLLGKRREMLQLPLTDRGEMSKREFLVRWSEPEILMQCIIVGR